MGSVRPDLPPLGDEIVDAVTAQELFLRSIAARCAHGGELIERNLDRDVLGTGVSQWIAAPLVVAIGPHPIVPVALAHLAGRRRVVHDNDPTTPTWSFTSKPAPLATIWPLALAVLVKVTVLPSPSVTRAE